MSIVKSESPRRNRITRLEKLAGGAILAAAAFAATPKLASASSVIFTEPGGSCTNPNAANAVSWFNNSNWEFISSGNTGPTGTLPETSGPGLGNGNVIIEQANPGAPYTNIGMPSVGVVFDPADDSLTPGGPNANYVANIESTQGSLLVGGLNATALSGTFTTNPSKLTIESGTMIVGGGSAASIFVGRDTPGILVQNGGILNAAIGGGKLEVTAANKTTIIGQGTYEYHGGTLLTGGIQVVGGDLTCGVFQTSAAVGTFIVYNDGPDGAILSGNGFSFDQNSKGFGDIGFVEFHYDLNTGGIGGVRPIQANWGAGVTQYGAGGTMKLAILQGTSPAAAGSADLTYTFYSSRLNLVLDTAPSLIGSGYAIVGGHIVYVLGTTPQNLGLFDETAISGNGTFIKAFYSADGSTVFTQGATISSVFAGNTYSWTISYSGQIQFTNTAVSGYNTTGIQSTGGTDVVLIGLAVPEPSTLTLLGGAASMILARRRQRKPRAEQT